MKPFKYLLPLLFLLAGCFEVNEEITINANGSGTYLTKMDMGGLVEVMKSMGGEEELAKNGLDRVIDTTMRLGAMMDSAEKLSAEEKKLLKDGTVKFKMNLDENLMKADVNVPYSSYNDLAKLMSGSAAGDFSNLFKSMMAQDSSRPASPAGTEPPAQINSIFDVTATNGTLARKLSRERYEKLMQRPEFEQIKQMTSMGMEIPYTTVIRLPRPVKSSDNALLKLSDDKKTITLKYDLVDLINQPEKYAYSVTY